MTEGGPEDNPDWAEACRPEAAVRAPSLVQAARDVCDSRVDSHDDLQWRGATTAGSHKRINELRVTLT